VLLGGTFYFAKTFVEADSKRNAAARARLAARKQQEQDTRNRWNQLRGVEQHQLGQQAQEENKL